MKHSMKIQGLLALTVITVAMMLTPLTTPVLAAKEEVHRPAIDVLLLGYYIWAKPGYVELCRKEGINIYGPLPVDGTGADPANYPVEFLKKFYVIVVSGPLEKPWDPCVVQGAIKPGIVSNLLEYNRQGGGLVWTRTIPPMGRSPAPSRAHPVLRL